MALKERLLRFWQDYRRDKFGMLGLALLLVFVAIALLYPFIGNMKVIENWDNIAWFSLYPKAVPPCWSSIFTGKSFEPTIIRGGDAVIVKTSRGFDNTLGLSYYNVTVIVPFGVVGDTPPSDVAVVANISYSVIGVARPVAVDKMVVVRPDGKVVEFVPPGSRADIGTVFTGFPEYNASIGRYTFKLSIEASNQRLILRYLLPRLMQKGVPVGFADIATIALRLYNAIFDKNFTGYLLTGKSSGVLRGEYRWIMSFIVYGNKSSFVFKPEKYVVIGSCYGVLGTDVYGRDLWQGLLYGVKWALIVGLATSILSVTFGTLYGIVGGYFGGAVDEVLLRVAQIVYSLPPLPILILLAALYRPSIWLIILALVAFSWPGTAFVTRAMALQIRQEPYVESAVALGASTARVLLFYVLPQVLPYVFASIALSVPGAIIAEASLSFLGVGDPSILTWGKILYEAQVNNAALNGYWWWVVPPGLAIALVGLSFIFIGSALDRILNPRLRR